MDSSKKGPYLKKWSNVRVGESDDDPVDLSAFALPVRVARYYIACCFVQEHTGRVFRLQFDEFQIVSSSHDDTILIWDFLNYKTAPAPIGPGFGAAPAVASVALPVDVAPAPNQPNPNDALDP